MRYSQKFLQKHCHGKVKHQTIDDVHLAGKIRMKKYNEVQLYFYLCKGCNKWHLTKKRAKYKVV